MANLRYFNDETLEQREITKEEARQMCIDDGQNEKLIDQFMLICDISKGQHFLSNGRIVYNGMI
jgi:hypothetical protein